MTLAGSPGQMESALRVEAIEELSRSADYRDDEDGGDREQVAIRAAEGHPQGTDGSAASSLAR